MNLFPIHYAPDGDGGTPPADPVVTTDESLKAKSDNAKMFSQSELNYHIGQRVGSEKEKQAKLQAELEAKSKELDEIKAKHDDLAKEYTTLKPLAEEASTLKLNQVLLQNGVAADKVDDFRTIVTAKNLLADKDGKPVDAAKVLPELKKAYGWAFGDGKPATPNHAPSSNSNGEPQKPIWQRTVFK